MSEVPEPVQNLVIKKVEAGEPIQVVFVFPELREQFERWINFKGWELFPIPTTEDDMPTFAIKAKE